METDLRAKVTELLLNHLSVKVKSCLVAGQDLIIDVKNELDTFDPNITDSLLNAPDDVTALFNSVLKDNYGEEMTARFRNLPDEFTVPISSLRINHEGKLVQLHGQIRLVTGVRPLVTRIIWECPTCGSPTTVVQDERNVSKPTFCPVCKKVPRGWKNAGEEKIDSQVVRLEEMPEEVINGKAQERIDVLVKGKLTERNFNKNLTPGNEVNVVGVLRSQHTFSSQGRELRIEDLIMDPSYIEVAKKEFGDIDLEQEDIKKIKEMSEDPLVFNRFRDSLAPHIYGWEEIKEGIILMLFGGVKTENARGDIHALLIGDPGNAKSELLEAAVRIAPKSRYLTGMGVSGVGLTATVTKDENSRNYVIEAGALPLVNGGFAAIDELDKMKEEDKTAMNEVLEQQTVTIAKGDVSGQLKAEVSVLAAANPKTEKFTLQDTIAAQISFPKTLLSRFDLIFPMIDTPEDSRDTLIFDKIMEKHSVAPAKAEVDTDIFRKYIAYARKNVKPEIPKDVAKVLLDFFLNLRRQSTDNTISITPREADGLIRLAKAAAKARLSPIVSLEDAQRAINLKMSYLRKVGIDPKTGQLATEKMLLGQRSNQQNKIDILISILRQGPPDGMNERDLCTRMHEYGLDNEETDRLIETLNKGEVHILRPRFGVLKLV